ncbi:hypothetical protein MTO96_041278 [Rhipicephalus appendiculatus]
MYPPDKYCNYLFYTNVVTSYTRIFPEKDPGSWYVFLRTVQNYKLMQLGISFSLRNVTPTDLDDAAPDLDYLRRQGIRHYGLLTVLAFSKEFDFTISSTKAIIKFNRTVKQYGGYRARTAWLFYNVQNVGSGNQCGDSPFNVLRLFCLALKGAMEPMCRG